MVFSVILTWASVRKKGLIRMDMYLFFYILLRSLILVLVWGCCGEGSSLAIWLVFVC